MKSLEKHLVKQHGLGKALCTAISKEMHRLGLSRDMCLHCADFKLKFDPASGEASLVGVWLDKADKRVGTILLHANGDAYAEYFVPESLNLGVEVIVAWGKGGKFEATSRQYRDHKVEHQISKPVASL